MYDVDDRALVGSMQRDMGDTATGRDVWMSNTMAVTATMSWSMVYLVQPTYRHLCGRGFPSIFELRKPKGMEQETSGTVPCVHLKQHKTITANWNKRREENATGFLACCNYTEVYTHSCIYLFTYEVWGFLLIAHWHASAAVNHTRTEGFARNFSVPKSHM